MKHVLRIGLATALLALSGCSVVDTIRPGSREGGSIERPAGSPASSPGGRLKPMPLRTFSLSTQCRFKDETGNFGSATVDVVNSKVNAFKAELTMPKRGTCRFDLAQFRQTQALPSVELTGAHPHLHSRTCHQRPGLRLAPADRQDHRPVRLIAPTSREQP